MCQALARPTKEGQSLISREASKSDLETLIANAVPMEMARRLGAVMRAREEGSRLLGD